MIFKTYIVVLFALVLFACNQENKTEMIKISSPDKNIQVIFDNTSSVPSYRVNYKGKAFINTSKLGFKLLNTGDLYGNFKVLAYDTSTYNQTWEQPWGEQRFINDHHNRLLVELEQNDSDHKKMNIEFKVFNDGIGFRYLVPKQEGLNDSVFISDELTEFAFAQKCKAWAIPAYNPWKYEIKFRLQPVADLDTSHTPLTIEMENGLYASIHEAALVDFSSITLYGTGNNTLKTDLVPWKDGIKVKTKTPFKTPWRTIGIGEKPGDLVESRLILNLNEPNKLGDVSWVKPMKYVGVWWDLHIGTLTFYPGKKLGATTERSKRYIDFAAKYGFDEVLIEGWNAGWDSLWQNNFSPNMNFCKANPQFNWQEVVDYAKSKNIHIQVYNETSANSENYLSQIDSAFTIYEKMGYRSAKIGQVNGKFKNGEWLHGQYAANYYLTVLKKAAAHKIAVNFHEPIKPTGLRRTYPNLVSQEGARGQEFNAWDTEGGNPPEHTCILPFTRLLGGPMDFTPGIFQVDIPQQPNNQVNATLAKELALYVVLYSPIQMAADRIENYKNRLDALQFIKDVPTDWETSKMIDGAIGDYAIMARKDKYSNDWYLGAITDEEGRDFSINLGFMDKGRTYEAQIYRDADGTDYRTNPTAYKIEHKNVTAGESLAINLPKGGGTAIRFKALK